MALLRFFIILSSVLVFVPVFADSEKKPEVKIVDLTIPPRPPSLQRRIVRMLETVDFGNFMRKWELKRACEIVSKFDWQKYGGRGSGEAAANLDFELDGNINTEFVHRLLFPPGGHGRWGSWTLIRTGAREIGLTDFNCPALKDWQPYFLDKTASIEEIQKDTTRLCEYTKDMMGEVFTSGWTKAEYVDVNVMSNLQTFPVANAWETSAQPLDGTSWPRLVSAFEKLGVPDYKCEHLRAYFENSAKP